MKSGRLVLVFFIAGMFFISGCTDIPGLSGILGGTEVKQYEHDIIVISGVKVTPAPSLRPGQTLNFHVYVKNNQDITTSSDPKEVTVTLYDTCGILTPKKDPLCSGNTPNVNQCIIEKMYPQSEEEIIWTLQANDIKVEQTCNLGVQVEYSHRTDTISSIEFASQTEVEKLVEQGRGKTSTGRMTAGEGPVKLYIQVPGQPILLKLDDKGSYGNGIVEFWVENKGSGSVVNNEVKRFVIENMESGIANIHFRKEIDSKDLGSTIDTDSMTNLTKKFIRSKTPVRNWVIEPKPVNSNRIDQKISFTLQLQGYVEYDYKFTKTTPVTVQPLI